MVTQESFNEKGDPTESFVLEPMRIFPYFHFSRILFLQASSRDEALLFLAELATQKKPREVREKFIRAIFERERLMSTGIGMGVAIPHAKMEAFSDFFITIGIQKKRALAWRALDRAPVRLIFMIGGSDQKQSEYLQILSHLTSAIKNASLRKKMLQSSSAQEILDLLKNF